MDYCKHASIVLRTLFLVNQPHNVEGDSLLPRPRRGLRGIVFTRSLCVYVCVCLCLCVCVSVCVSGQYFGILFLGH